MRHILPILLACLLLPALSAVEAAAPAAPPKPAAGPAQPAAPAAPQAPIVVAVLPCEMGSFDLADLARALPTLISTDLSLDKSLTLVERERLDQVLQEQSLGTSGLIDGDAAARIGKLLGARLLILPRTFAVEKQLFVSAKVVNVETGRVVSATKSSQLRNANPTLLAGLIAEEVQRLIGGGVAQVGPSDDEHYRQLIADLAKLLGERKRPSVTVVVPEEQLHRIIPDPAVKTELCYLLRKLHFRVIENDSPLLDQWVHDYFAGHASKFPAEVGDVDLVIYGGAFAETVGAHGNLISARARLELSAILVKSAEIIAVGRATGSAADISENVAGKSALVNATLNAAKDFMSDLITDWDRLPH